MRSEKHLIYAVFILIALCLILIAAVVNQVDPNGIAADIIKDIGIVVGAVALVDILWGRFGGDPLSQQIEKLKQLNSIMTDAETTGLTHVFSRAADVKSTNWLSSIQGARGSIDLAGHTLYQVAERSELCSALVGQARKGVKVRILINHPENPALPLSVDADYGNLRAMSEQMDHTWNYFQSLRDQLPPACWENMKIARLREGVLHIALRRFDGLMYVLNYLYSKRSPDTPVYVAEDEERPLFSTYMQEFDRLFQRAEKAPEKAVPLEGETANSHERKAKGA